MRSGAFHCPGPRAHANWTRLAPAEKAVVLERARDALRADRARSLRALGAGVVTVGIGRRMRGGRTPKRHGSAELVLSVHVEEKKGADWAGSAGRGELVPPYVEVEVASPRDGRLRPFAVPTDVRALGEGLRASGGGSKQDVRAANEDGRDFVDGTACALLRRDADGDGRRYLLGCHHVLRRSLLTPDASPKDPTVVAAGGIALGPVVGQAPFGQDEPDSVDAALVRLTRAGAAVVGAGDYWRTAPREIVASAAECLALQPGVFTLYPRCTSSAERLRERVLLRMIDIVDRFPITYLGGGRVTMREVLLFEPFAGRAQEGDSGAPVVIGGRLAGMHVAGDTPSDDKGRRSPRVAAIPAYVLLERGLITGGEALRLAASDGPASEGCS